MADSQGGTSHESLSQPPEFNQQGLASTLLAEKATSYGTKGPEADAGANLEAEKEAIKDRIDDAVPKGPKRADPSSGGRVMVGEEGDLHDLAAKRHS